MDKDLKNKEFKNSEDDTETNKKKDPIAEQERIARHVANRLAGLKMDRTRKNIF